MHVVCLVLEAFRATHTVGATSYQDHLPHQSIDMNCSVWCAFLKPLHASISLAYSKFWFNQKTFIHDAKETATLYLSQLCSSTRLLSHLNWKTFELPLVELTLLEPSREKLSWMAGFFYVLTILYIAHTAVEDLSLVQQY